MMLSNRGARWARRERRNQLAGMLFALPAILGFLVYVITPMILSFWYSLTDFSVFKQAVDFIGAANYRNLFSGGDPYFYTSLRVTLYYMVLNVPAMLLFSMLVAMLLNERIKGRALLRSVFYLPSIVPAVAACMIWQYLLNPDLGLFNSVLKSLGLSKSMWLYNEKSVIPTLVMTNLWNTGSTMVVFLAGLQNIPRQYYEALDVDGGNGWHKFFYITLPMMTPTIFFNAIMSVISSLQAFEKAYILTEGGPNNASLFYSYLVYREAFKNTRMAHACALGWVLFLVTLVITGIIFLTQKYWVYYEGGDRG